MLGLGELSFGMKIVSSIRAYVGGEGLWSKTQKEAVNSLIAYSRSFDESDYQSFLTLLQVPLGDRQARLELEKKNPDLAIARQGFIAGRNDPDDADDMIFLYRRFRQVSYMSQAIDIWTEGDRGIIELLQVGHEMHTVVNGASTTKQTNLVASVAPLVEKAYIIDERLTMLEDRFSAILGEGSRHIRRLFFWIAVAVTGVFGIAALFVVLLIRKILVEVDTAKNEFVSLASHQLKAPLTSISWYTEMLLSGQVGSLTGKAYGYLNKVWHNAQRMVALVNSLLNVSRIEIGTMGIVPELIHITLIADSILDVLEPSIIAKKLVVNKSYDKHIPIISADPKLVRIILQNLLSNAVKYTAPHGNVSLTIKAQAKEIFIQVSDNGCGIPYNQQSRIFTKLFRADNAQAIDTDGSGLGLYIVKSVVEQTGGAVWFESVENKGTNFYVTLPIGGMPSVAGEKDLV